MAERNYEGSATQEETLSSEKFGQLEPPLSITIKSILERYPDGQIFKEIIQNADDAGAKTVWFYVDERQHGTSNLPHPDLARFQGPALVAANDASFMEKDWEGIRMLQQSIKAEDPFKVGRFGIGFNSVYHLTDLPMIVSGKRLGCFEPQRILWKGESGKAYDIPQLIGQSSDFVAPLYGLAGFDPDSVKQEGYPHTLFRLPLRTEASGLSENIYNTEKLTELLDALRKEAKYLLLFLKSVCKIQVMYVTRNGQQSTSFCVEIAPKDSQRVTFKRDLFLKELKRAHKDQPYQISKVISFTARYTVVVTDNNRAGNQTGTSEWLIANCVGSADRAVQAAAAKLHIFPWVGAVLELGEKSTGGRIFCFLPMPVEASSGLPIHINGTFGLNDERRTLKWPGVERKNDPTANWNKTLVSELLPPCYAMLLTEAKNHMPLEHFYNAWPNVNIVKDTQFSEILKSFFSLFFKQAIVWAEEVEALQQAGSWVRVPDATLVKDDNLSLTPIIREVLSKCKVKLVTVPPLIWQAIQFSKVSSAEISPKLARNSLRSHPKSYSNLEPSSKIELLMYCLSDNCFDSLTGLKLLPLADGTFTIFDTEETVYLCSDDCPRQLLPNIDHLLVDMSGDQSVQQMLYRVATSQKTKLKVLGEKKVADLLIHILPPKYRNSSVNEVSLKHSQLSLQWLQTLWTWLSSKNLKNFHNRLIVPYYSSTSHSNKRFHLTRLNIEQPVIYVGSHTSCSKDLLSALYKMKIRACIQSEFSFVQHKLLSTYIHQFDSKSVLDLAYQLNYEESAFSASEAESLRIFLGSKTSSLSKNGKTVLKNLVIFTSASNSGGQLFSVSSAASKSILITKQALREPSDSVINISNLPPNVILLSNAEYHQQQLLEALQIPVPSDYQLLDKHIFPLIRSGGFPDHLIDSVMTVVLDMFQILNTRESSSNLSKSLQELPFVRIKTGRKSPKELFDPYNTVTSVVALYSGEDVFPYAPYDTRERIRILSTYCGLRDLVTPQEVLEIVYSISSPTSLTPCQVSALKFNRSKAVLEYISTPDFYKQPSGHYPLPGIKGKHSFPDGLKLLAASRCWLPVLSERPPDYCDQLSWKGSDYNSHFVSLNSSVVVLSHSTVHTFPHLVGSQMYLVSPALPPKIAAKLPTELDSVAKHSVAHFKKILACKKQLSVSEMDTLVHKVYQFLNSEELDLSYLYSIREWIYIKKDNKFVAPAIVALKQNPEFKIDLEPYLYILPERLSEYRRLFGSDSRVTPVVTQGQILAILKIIKEDVQAGVKRMSSKETWRMVMSILNWLTHDGTKSVSEEINPARVFIPVESESEWPQLEQASKVAYTDSEFLKDYIQSSDEKDSYKFMHDHISVDLADCLGAISLEDLLGISEETFTDTGQHEPLTTRLKNILRDYKDGLTIFKELLQNADDAEATEVNVCYDSRQHVKASKKLFFAGMAEAHGPALVVHNNSTFSNADFENITKLAGATKEEQVLKIGKFGIGFCSVYHMTDIPSFVSGDYLSIFDPTVSCLRKEITNLARPGKKIQFTKKFISRSKQLDPYDELFGFDRTKSYQGTMFRLPFRTGPSELSGTCYTEASVKELISSIRDNGTNLLLFLQHVKTITFQRIDPGQTEPKVLLKIIQKDVSLPLSVCLPDNTSVRQISHSDSSKSFKWLVSQNSRTDSQQEYHTASVACPLGSSSYKVDPNFEGEIFCFLPLSQKTGLPVHVSSNFAVINNRRGIWTSDEATSQTDTEVTWNIKLMKGVIAEAYHELLLALKEMANNKLLSNYKFYCLWPRKEKLLQHNPWDHFIHQVYKFISPDQLFYSAYRKEWLYLNKCKFLAPKILCQTSEQSTPSCVFEVFKHLNTPIVDLPISYHEYINLQSATINESSFIKIFFKNLDSLESILSTRSEVIQCMLEVYTAEYDDETQRSYNLDEYLKKYSCIPCSPDGKILRKCTEVVDPMAPFASLFDPSEGRFPLEQLSERHLSYTALEGLGMISKFIPRDMLVERARTISGLYKSDKSKALERVHLILSSCAKVKFDKPQDTQKRTYSRPAEHTSRIDLTTIPFLPVLPRPSEYHLPIWKGDGQELMCGKDLMLEGGINSYLAGSQAAFVSQKSISEGGCGHIKHEAIEMIKIRKEPSVKEVLAHLKEVQRFFHSQQITEELITSTHRMCRQVYEFLDKLLESEKCKEIDCLAIQRLSHVWTGSEFVEIKLVAQDMWSKDGPYLYRLPFLLSSQENLLKCLKIKEHFSFDDLQNALTKMKSCFGDNPVDENCQDVIENAVLLLQKLMLNETETHTLFLPNEHYVLHPSNELAYNDVDWAPRDPEHTYVHNIVQPQLAKKLGVQPTRAKTLENFISPHSRFESFNFGQREKLTRKIQNILRDYPFDITILKELLQNADDAKATKMYFILDERTHRSQGVLSKNWGKLQGPAFLVWNDSVFSEKDLDGIQELGLGSKRYDFETIGHFGIGFNVVYHLTDCPSFITGGETLCVLDPHCEYVHEASELYPGRRFDGLSKGFWQYFPDMSSSYLRSGLDNCPPEMMGGSLFRFPLRSTEEHFENSKIIQKDTKGSGPITSDVLLKKLQEWAPKMKEAMLFLNHVKELQFIVIGEHSTHLDIKKRYCTEVDEYAVQSRKTLLDTLSAFKDEQGGRSIVIRYPLTISDIGSNGSKDEKWLIQQGVGDIDNEQQIWTFVKTVKPRHGIAAPIPSPQKPQLSEVVSSKVEQFSEKKKFVGSMFCFLPLPVSSELPVHVNGNFILNSSRRTLWSSSEVGREDDRSAWNSRLFQAIASSYTNFLYNSRSYYTSSNPYKNWAAVNADIDKYYDIFPRTDLDKPFKALAKSVYDKLVQKNLKILAVVNKKESGIKSHESSKQSTKVIDWYPPKSISPSDQVHFWSFSTGDWKTIKSIIESIGMKVTAANGNIQTYLNEAIKETGSEIQSCSPEMVFKYYCNFCSQASPVTGQFPCEIKDSVFRTVSTFKTFTEYLLQRSKHDGIFKSDSAKAEEFAFPNEPFGHPLLLTADSHLRRFKESEKVIKSHFANLFHKSPEEFLHPDMVEVPYKSKYFVTCSGLFLNNPYSLLLVEKLLLKHLPSSIRAKRVSQLPFDLTRNQLANYWKCFQEDSVFHSNLSKFLKEWALLPTILGSLHSSSDSLVPIMPPPEKKENEAKSENDDILEQMYPILKKMGLPFLNVGITGPEVSQFCLTISKEVDMLKAIYHLSQEADLSSIIRDRAETVILYLRKIDFRFNRESLKYVKLLPLFECIDGIFRGVGDKTAYIWPSNACAVGYSDWIEYLPSVVFLKEDAHWTNLTSSPEILGIKTIETEELYYKFIFSCFSTLWESDRYYHLAYIKDNLFPRNKLLKNSKVTIYSNDRERAIKFLKELQALHCIGEDGEALKPVSDYCNHEAEIFKTFQEHFNFLPDTFMNSWSDWCEFFEELGLKHTVSKSEFQQFCRDVSDGHHEDPIRASSVLLESLCSENAKKEGWHVDTKFLSEIGDIPFVPTQCPLEIAWIRIPQIGSKQLIINGQELSLAKLNEAAVPECAVYMWTIKPIVELPPDLLPAIIPEHTELARKLGITCKATVSDVIKNVRNITASKRFTDFQNFDQYPDSNKPPDTHKTKSLMTVMVENLSFLETNYYTLSGDQVQLLKDTPCIPVYSTFMKTHSWQVVLVEPQGVLRYGVITTDDYHPYLHSLDDELSSLNQLLKLLGIETSIGFSHIQYVLNKAYECSNNQELKQESQNCVYAILFKLFNLLNQSSTTAAKKLSLNEISDVLSPLYLPNTNNKLALSTTLLYVDDDNFKGNLFPTLEGTDYSMIKIRNPEKGLTIYDKEFCELLPEKIRPIGLSTVCSQTVLSTCLAVPDTNAGKLLSETFEMKETLSKAISACVQYLAKTKQEVDTVASEFFSSIEIKTMKQLRMAIRFKETNEMLGELDTKFFLQIPADNTLTRCLYLDSKMSTKPSYLFTKMIGLLATKLLELIRVRMEQPQLINAEIYSTLLKVVSYLLNAQSPIEVQEIMDDNHIPLTGKGMDNLSFKLGREVPEYWHHRLDQTIENVFHPGEIVGYEEMENKVVYAMIMHPILPEGVESFDDIPRVRMRYKIMTNPEDEEGTEVNVLKLYKFLIGLKNKEKPMSEGTDLVLYEGETETAHLQQELHKESLQEICADLKRQLDEIWKLPEADRKKAIRRLCLKWHPDKNLDNQDLAEEVFKFLNSEISRRDASNDVQWDDIQRTARRQRESYEWEWFSWSSGGGGGHSFFSNSRWGGPSFTNNRWQGFSARMPTFDEEKVRPQSNVIEGRRWLKQAKANFNSLLLLYSGSQSDPSVCGDICFMAHQVAEKALKGGKYFVCGLDDNSLRTHKLSTHAYGLQSEKPRNTAGLVFHTIPLEDYYYNPRYPNCWPSGVVPADRYNFEQAETAMNHAQAILHIMEGIVMP